jgi:hypothetical protein
VRKVSSALMLENHRLLEVPLSHSCVKIQVLGGARPGVRPTNGLWKEACEHSMTSQKRWIFSTTAVKPRISNRQVKFCRQRDHKYNYILHINYSFYIRIQTRRQENFGCVIDKFKNTEGKGVDVSRSWKFLGDPVGQGSGYSWLSALWRW